MIYGREIFPKKRREKIHLFSIISQIICHMALTENPVHAYGIYVLLSYILSVTNVCKLIVLPATPISFWQGVDTRLVFIVCNSKGSFVYFINFIIWLFSCCQASRVMNSINTEWSEKISLWFSVHYSLSNWKSECRELG